MVLAYGQFITNTCRLSPKLYITITQLQIYCINPTYKLHLQLTYLDVPFIDMQLNKQNNSKIEKSDVFCNEQLQSINIYISRQGGGMYILKREISFFEMVRDISFFFFSNYRALATLQCILDISWLLV